MKTKHIALDAEIYTYVAARARDAGFSVKKYIELAAVHCASTDAHRIWVTQAMHCNGTELESLPKTVE